MLGSIGYGFCLTVFMIGIKNNKIWCLLYYLLLNKMKFFTNWFLMDNLWAHYLQKNLIGKPPMPNNMSILDEIAMFEALTTDHKTILYMYKLFYSIKPRWTINWDCEILLYLFLISNKKKIYTSLNSCKVKMKWMCLIFCLAYQPIKDLTDWWCYLHIVSLFN